MHDLNKARRGHRDCPVSAGGAIEHDPSGRAASAQSAEIRGRVGERPSRGGGLPGDLQFSVEALSQVAMGDVSVTYNSPRPAEMGALAYTQGANIHLGPGQEDHLAHEAWHVVQQKRGDVKPNETYRGVKVNRSAHLERDADHMGARAARLSGEGCAHGGAPAGRDLASSQTMQFKEEGEEEAAVASGFVSFSSDGTWDADAVLAALGDVPSGLATAIEDGPRETAKFVVGLRDRVDAAVAADKTKAKVYSSIRKSLTSRVSDLWFASSKSPLEWFHLIEIVQWTKQFDPDQPAPAEDKSPAGPKPITDPHDERLSQGRRDLIWEGERRMGSIKMFDGKGGASYSFAEDPPNSDIEDKDRENLFDRAQEQTEGTSCGLLPGVLLRELGVKGILAQWGTELEANATPDVWVKASSGAKPLPGDVYQTKALDGQTAHVGIVYRLDIQTEMGLTWETLDAGQDNNWSRQAHKLTQKVDYKKGGIFLEQIAPLKTGEQRKVAGWIDLDKLLKKQGLSKSDLPAE